MKVMNLTDIAEQELDVLMNLEHENVLQYFESFEVQLNYNNSISKPNLCIITEFCEVLFTF